MFRGRTHLPLCHGDCFSVAKSGYSSSVWPSRRGKLFRHSSHYNALLTTDWKDTLSPITLMYLLIICKLLLSWNIVFPLQWIIFPQIIFFLFTRMLSLLLKKGLISFCSSSGLLCKIIWYSFFYYYLFILTVIRWSLFTSSILLYPFSLPRVCV